jgi:DNA-binding response OmpR family regulator
MKTSTTMNMETSETILVVEDDRGVMICIMQILDKVGYHVLTAKDGIEALTTLRSHAVDLILTDIGMPRMNGYQLYEHVIENPQWMMIPFIFLTARALDSDIRYAKELGVDDYLTKPFTPEDLLAAVRGKLRRARRLAHLPMQPISQPMPESPVLTIGRLRIDPKQYRVWMDDELIKLSAKEFDLLERLAQQAREVVSLSELIKATHGLDIGPSEAGELLRPLIRSVRRKLGYQAGDMGCIQNVRGVGYRLIPPNNPH